MHSRLQFMSTFSYRKTNAGQVIVAAMLGSLAAGRVSLL